ncbi:MAG: beta-propeller domain-containing protein [Coriobacteriales bacterium]|jgi:uncharacterized secreted protein with C-terminal beta-propeller domain|nr:beta-propeller domain-containing protein [Coriobacteriales bacterium]
MTENNTPLDDTERNEIFDAQLRAVAHEMREQMQPETVVIDRTRAAARLAEDEPAIQTETQASTPPVAQTVLPSPSGTPVYPALVYTNTTRPKKRRRGRILGALAATLTAAAAVVVVVGSVAVYQSTSSPVLTSSVISATGIITPGSYADVYTSLETRAFGFAGEGISTLEVAPLLNSDAGGAASTDSAAPDSAGSARTEGQESTGSSASAEATATGPGGASGSYSQTNTQVEGVDEADIVKTDGRNIYSLATYYDEIIITRASGRSTEELARISTKNSSVEDLYVKDGRLVVLSHQIDSSDSESGYYQDASRVAVAIYDVSDPSHPELMNVFGQDGSLNTSRLVDGMLYVASVYWIYESNCEPEDPRSFVPNLYKSEDTAELLSDSLAAEPVAVADIRILPDYESAAYTVLTAIEVDTATRESEISVLGSTETVYMNEDNLFLAATVYDYGSVMPLIEEQRQYTVDAGLIEPKRIPLLPWEILDLLLHPEDWYEDADSRSSSGSSSSPAPMMAPNPSSYQPHTRITRLALNRGSLDVAASTTFEGTLLNQFSLDEYRGYLRVAATVTSDEYETLSRGGETERLWNGTTTSNSLLIFDDQLELVGRIKDLAPGERIYSARFSGDVGYMVTFRQTDPLFALDLSNPEKPRVMDALKIPGFSQYLHPYANGLLLGLGQDASSSGALTGYLKLSMFDVSDPFAVREADKELVDALYSEALNNHKAVLIDEEKNLIGFSAEMTRRSEGFEEFDRYQLAFYYLIYGYDSETGFSERAAIELPEEYGPARALYIDDYLYLVNGDNIGVFSLDTLEEITWVRL